MIILKYVQGRDISYCDNLLKTIQDKQCVECKKNNSSFNKNRKLK